MQEHRSRVTGQLFGPKADVEFPHLSDYLGSVHLLGASFSATWGLSNPIFAANGGTFLATRARALIRYPWIQVTNFLRFTVYAFSTT